MIVSASQKAYQRLCEKLLSGQLKPGSQLINRALAKELGVSAIPVREALVRLSCEGLVRFDPEGEGAFVHAPDAGELQQLSAWRLLLETLAVKWAATQSDAQYCAELSRCANSLREIAQELQSRHQSCATAAQFGVWFSRRTNYQELLMSASGNAHLTGAALSARMKICVFSPRVRAPEDLTLTVAVRAWRIRAALARAISKKEPEKAQFWAGELIKDEQADGH